MFAGNLTDEKVDQVIGSILQAGVLLSGLVVLIGGVLYLIQFGLTPANYRSFSPELAAVHGLSPIFSGALRLDGRSIIQVGILILVATPVIRVIFSVFAFVLQRDHLYVTITLIVLGILFYGLSG
jgi:uncharacterized membrane protein